jgi:hypothetical protein
MRARIAATSCVVAVVASTILSPVIAHAGTTSWAPENEAGDHSVSRSEAVAEARRFDVIVALRWTYRAHVGAMKAANPDLVLLAYMNGTFAQRSQRRAYPAAWYMRNRSGKKVTSKGFGNYLMKFGHPGWIQDRRRECAAAISYSGYDGCMLDMLGTAPLSPGYLTSLPINPRTGKVWTTAQWLAGTSGLAGSVKRAVAPRTVLGNGIGNGPRYFAAGAASERILEGIDGGLAEAFIRASRSGIRKYRTERAWRQDVEMLVDAGARGDPILALTKTWVPGTAAQKRAWHRYALASFLLGSDGRSRFSFSPGRERDPTRDHPWWKVDLGAPTGRYGKADGVYQRSFTKGKVLVNPTDRTFTVWLGGPYVDLRGKVRTSVTLGPHDAEILTRPA